MVENLKQTPEYSSHEDAAEMWIQQLSQISDSDQSDLEDDRKEKPRSGFVGTRDLSLMRANYIKMQQTGRRVSTPDRMFQPKEKPERSSLPPVLLTIAGRVHSSSVETWKKQLEEHEIEYQVLTISTIISTPLPDTKFGTHSYKLQLGDQSLELPFTSSMIQANRNPASDIVNPLTALELAFVAPTLPAMEEILGLKDYVQITLGATNSKSPHFSLKPLNLTPEVLQSHRFTIYNPNSFSFFELEAAI